MKNIIMKTMKKVFLRMRSILFILITICVIASNVTADNVTYTYDDAGRLTKAYYGNGRAIKFTYDKAGNIIEKKVSTTADPIPDIKANSSDGSVTPIVNLSVTVALDPGSLFSGDDADWWVVANVSGTSTIDGWYYYDLSAFKFVPVGDSPFNLIVTHQGTLFNLATFPVLNNIPVSVLPPGTYTFYFAIDTVVNGVLDLSVMFSDSVIVNITP